MTVATHKPTGRDQVTDALVAAAAKLFCERDPKEPSLRDIAAAAGVNHGLVHHYFGTKNTLIAAVLDRRAHELAARVDANADLYAVVESMVQDPDSHAFTRLLAYAVIEGWDNDDARLDGWITRRLLEMVDPGDVASSNPNAASTADAPSTRVAAILALIMGWDLFRDVLLPLVDVDPDDPDIDGAITDLAVELGARPYQR